MRLCKSICVLFHTRRVSDSLDRLSRSRKPWRGINPLLESYNRFAFSGFPFFSVQISIPLWLFPKDRVAPRLRRLVTMRRSCELRLQAWSISSLNFVLAQKYRCAGANLTGTCSALAKRNSDRQKADSVEFAATTKQKAIKQDQTRHQTRRSAHRIVSDRRRHRTSPSRSFSVSLYEEGIEFRCSQWKLSAISLISTAKHQEKDQATREILTQIDHARKSLDELLQEGKVSLTFDGRRRSAAD